MKFRNIMLLVAVAGAACFVSASTRAKSGTAISSGQENASAKPYLGPWDLTLKSAEREYPSWLELKEESGSLKAEFVGRWGNARPLPKAELKDGSLTFVSPKEEEGLKEDMVFTGKLEGDELHGTVNGTNGKQWTWTGVRAPALKETGTPKWGKPVALFDGRSLNGWKMQPARGTPVWTVKDGSLVTPGNGPELINEQKFKDFKLHVEFNAWPDSNSGIYLRGRYEVQVETDSQSEPANRQIGSIYGFLAPQPAQPRKPNIWQKYDITLIGRTITVKQNGKTIIDRMEIPGITGGALDSHEGEPGPIYLQGSEKGHVLYRSIVITPAE